MRVKKSPHHTAESQFCHGFDFPFLCVTTVAFTLGFLSLYLSLSLRQIIPIYDLGDTARSAPRRLDRCALRAERPVVVIAHYV